MHVIWLFLIFIFSPFIPQVVHAADSDLVISEIASYESSDHEWIEIFNKGSTAIDVTGWKFFEDGTNHGLTAYRGGLVIQPGGYAVIADNALNTATDYPQNQGILIDSSWTTLNESGELIGLKNSTATIIEQFTYISAPDHSLERIDPLVSDYTAINWKEHPTGNTIGAAYAQQSSPIPQQAQNQASQSQQQSIAKPTKGSIVINELISDPSDEEKEWVELYNVLSQAIDLSGWSITNGSGKILPLAGILQGSGLQKYLVVETSGGMLKNLGDKISLLDSQKEVIDSVSYGSWDDGILGDNAMRAINPNSLTRKVDGYNTRMNSNDFTITTTPTKGSANIVTSEPIEQTEKPTKDAQIKSQASIIISELLPNPSSHNPKDEFIELTNEGVTDIDLDGWRLIDEEEREFVFSKNGTIKTVLKPKEYVIIGRDTSGIALNNSGGETIKLYEKGAQKAHVTLRYSENAVKNMSYSRDAHGRYVWTTQVTPGEQNNIVVPNRPPFLSVDWPKTLVEGEEVIFDATDTFDPDNDPFSVSWDFGDGTKKEGLYVSQVFKQSGSLTASVHARDKEREATMQRRLSIAGKNIGSTQPKSEQQEQILQAQQVEEVYYSIVLNELLPNPSGSDSNEFIELKNIGTVSADISGWMLSSSKGTQRYIFVQGTHINPNGLLVVPKKELPFSQSNAYDLITLSSPNGKQVDVIDFDDAPSGMSYARTSQGDWLWTKQITSNKENNVDGVYDERGVKEDAPTSQSNAVKSDKKQVAQQGIECSIVVVPGIVGKNIAYCANPSYRIRFTLQTIPPLRQGDRVRLIGKITHPNGQTLLTIRNISDVVIKTHGAAIIPKDYEIEDIADDDLASLIHVRGVISRIQWPSIWIGDGEYEIRAYVYKATSIEKPTILIGDTMDITGVLDKTSSGYRILPRSLQDIRITIKERQSTTGNSLEEKQGTRPKNKGGYVLATLAALAIVSGGLMIQHLGKKG